jgi:hypothetical protein
LNELGDPKKLSSVHASCQPSMEHFYFWTHDINGIPAYITLGHLGVDSSIFMVRIVWVLLVKPTRCRRSGKEGVRRKGPVSGIPPSR